MKNMLDYFETQKEVLNNRIVDLGNGSPFYKRLLRRTVKKIESGEQIDFTFYNEIPRTTKDDLKRNHPFGLLKADKSEIRGYFESSGTTDESIGSSKTSSLRTGNDLERDYRRRVPEWMAGVEKGDFAVIHLPYALTSSGVAFHDALSKLGIVPVALDQGHSFSSYSRVYDLLKTLEAKVLVCSNPLLLRDIILYEQKEDLFKLPSLQYILMVGTAFSEKSRRLIEERSGKKVGLFYGMSEFGAIGVPCSKGHVHIHPDFFIEILNPNNTDEHYSQGSLGGEMVLTDLKSEGTPFLKYRTGDAGRIYFEECGCEMNNPRIEVFGRLKDVIKDNDKLLFPTDFQDLLAGLEHTSPIHKLVAKGEEEILLELHIQQVTESKEELDIIEDRIKSLTNIPISIITYKFGELFEDIYNQGFYRTTQKVKTMSFHDERKGEWIITY